VCTDRKTVEMIVKSAIGSWIIVRVVKWDIARPDAKKNPLDQAFLSTTVHILVKVCTGLC